ncbi:hypothetical protein O3M35_010921 [Rhynocoris fuscipes]|uniref:Uncharacterized protein n=1 Tax=Rhynocoris fuscipes TaxID=488301 RepID=A0AAW1D8G3_9HEMI
MSKLLHLIILITCSLGDVIQYGCRPLNRVALQFAARIVLLVIGIPDKKAACILGLSRLIPEEMIYYAGVLR